MRLIDADALIGEMKKWYFDSEKQKAAEQDCSPMDLFTNLAITTVCKQPTVCDLGKVVEQLEEKVQLAYRRYMDCPSYSPCFERYQTQYMERKMCLEIVKGDGANEKENRVHLEKW